MKENSVKLNSMEKDPIYIVFYTLSTIRMVSHELRRLWPQIYVHINRLKRFVNGLLQLPKWNVNGLPHFDRIITFVNIVCLFVYISNWKWLNQISKYLQNRIHWITNLKKKLNFPHSKDKWKAHSDSSIVKKHKNVYFNY